MGKTKLGFHFDQSNCAIMACNLWGRLETNLRRQPPEDRTPIILGSVAVGLALVMLIACLIAFRKDFNDTIK